MEATLWNTHVWQHFFGPGLAMIAAVGGWSSLLAVTIDLVRLEISHMTVLMVWFRT